MKIKKLTDLSIAKLNTLDINEIKQLDDNTSPLQLLGEENYQIEEFNIEIDSELISKNLLSRASNNGQCAIIIYELFNKLARMTLLDPGFWTYYSVGEFWPYTKLKYMQEDEAVTNYYKNALLINSKFDKILSNSIARLYWIVDLTITNGEDPYIYTQYLFTNPAIEQNIFKLDVSLNKNFLKTFIQSMLELQLIDMNFIKDDPKFQKYLIDSIIIKSGFSTFDFYTKEDMTEYINNKAHEYNLIIGAKLDE